MSPRPSGSPNLATLSGVSEFVFATKDQQNTNLGLNNHIMFDVVQTFRGGLYITLDTLSTYTTTLGAASVGRFTLKPGPSYKLQANLGFVQQDAVSAQHVYSWYDATVGAVIEAPIQIQPYSNTNHISNSNTLTAVFTPTRQTLVEVRLVESVANSVSQIGLDFRSKAWALVETI